MFNTVIGSQILKILVFQEKWVYLKTKDVSDFTKMLAKQTRRETSLKTDTIPEWVVALSEKKIVQNC